jgi:hypothetical protein
MQHEMLTDAKALDRMATLKAKLLDPFGPASRYLRTGRGWDLRDKLWQIHPTRFQGDFSPLVKAWRGRELRWACGTAPSAAITSLARSGWQPADATVMRSPPAAATSAWPVPVTTSGSRTRARHGTAVTT